MKKAILAALLCASPMFAVAQTADSDQPSVRVPARGFEVPQSRWSMQLTNFGNYKGGWDLSDGRILYLTSRGAKMFAQIEGQEKTELAAAGMNNFVALDRSMRINMRQDVAGEVGGEVLLPARDMVTGMAAEPVRLSLR